MLQSLEEVSDEDYLSHSQFGSTINFIPGLHISSLYKWMNTFQIHPQRVIDRSKQSSMYISVFWFGLFPSVLSTSSNLRLTGPRGTEQLSPSSPQQYGDQACFQSCNLINLQPASLAVLLGKWNLEWGGFFLTLAHPFPVCEWSLDCFLAFTPKS